MTYIYQQFPSNFSNINTKTNLSEYTASQALSGPIGGVLFIFRIEISKEFQYIFLALKSVKKISFSFFVNFCFKFFF